MPDVISQFQLRKPVAAHYPPLPVMLAYTVGLLNNWRSYTSLTWLLLALEGAVGLLLILRGSYTDVDYNAYMEQVSAWRGGEMDYKSIRGGTGPLVYPAGHLYLYGALQWLAGGSSPTLLVHGIFLAVYLATLFAALRLYSHVGSAAGAPPWVACLFIFSYRLHSLYTLRLFNDCWSALGVLGSIALLSEGQWLAGVAVWSLLGVGVKMNGLLVLPALGLVLLRNTGPLRTALYLLAAGGLQLALAAPFLLEPQPVPWNYFSQAFQFGRESRLGDVEEDRTQGYYLHVWSVNWGLLPTAVFTSPHFGTALLAAHLSLLLYLAHSQWSGADGLPGVLLKTAAAAGLLAPPRDGGGTGGRKRERSLPPPTPSGKLGGWFKGAYSDSPSSIALPLLLCNFVGIVFMRSLHYQFYAWYALTLPILAWGAAPSLPTWARLLALGCIEAGFSFSVLLRLGAKVPGLGPFVAAHLGACVVPGREAKDCAPWIGSCLVAAGHALLLGGVLLAAPRRQKRS